MIFVDRKTPGLVKIIEESSQVIKELGVDVAIFLRDSGTGLAAAMEQLKSEDTTTGRPVGSGPFRRGFHEGGRTLEDARCRYFPIGIVGAALVIPAATFSVSAHRTVTYTIGPAFGWHMARNTRTGLLHDVELIVRRAAHKS